MKKIFLVTVIMSLGLSLLLAASVTGFVTDQATGDPVENAFVKFQLVRPNGNGGGNGHGGHGGHGPHGPQNPGDCDGSGEGPHGPQNPDGNLPRVFEVQTDATGQYLIENMPEGTYVARAGKRLEYRMLMVRDIVLAEELVNLDFALTAHIPPTEAPLNRFKSFFNSRK